MAGGIGTRFWPKSRVEKPKQFLDILGNGKTFIRATYERFLPVVPAENMIVVTNERYRDLVKESIPEMLDENILCEPMGRNTAPCIAFAAFYIKALNPNAKMVVTPADHFIADTKGFCEVIESSLNFIESQEALMTIGIEPSYPESGYGYIQRENDSVISPVKSFSEKPTVEIAQTFLASGDFMWNSGLFIWSCEAIHNALKSHLPELYTIFDSIADTFTTPQQEAAIQRAFAECRPISIDYGVMEKADNAYVHRGSFGWSDVGTWNSVHKLMEKDEVGNTISEDNFFFDSKNIMVSTPSGKITAISGLSDFIVVDTDDVLMICPKSEDQNIKKFIDELKYRKKDSNI
ncbi:MAG: sugar phosphate nucleotidyltransferase [Rikenellaceae bacterium]